MGTRGTFRISAISLADTFRAAVYVGHSQAPRQPVVSPPMEPTATYRAAASLVLLALALPLCLGGCPHRAPPAAGDEAWYRKEGVFDAFDVDAAGLSLGNAYLLELAC